MLILFWSCFFPSTKPPPKKLLLLMIHFTFYNTAALIPLFSYETALTITITSHCTQNLTLLLFFSLLPCIVLLYILGLGFFFFSNFWLLDVHVVCLEFGGCISTYFFAFVKHNLWQTLLCNSWLFEKIWLQSLYNYMQFF